MSVMGFPRGLNITLQRREGLLRATQVTGLQGTLQRLKVLAGLTVLPKQLTGAAGFGAVLNVLLKRREGALGG